VSYHEDARHTTVTTIGLAPDSHPIGSKAQLKLQIIDKHTQQMLWDQRNRFYTTRDILVIDEHDMGEIDYSIPPECSEIVDGLYLLCILWDTYSETQESQFICTSEEHIVCLPDEVDEYDYDQQF
jgi:hypothetical protein